MLVQTVTLTIGFNPEGCDAPDSWDWHGLLDVGSGCWILEAKSDDMRPPVPSEQRNYDEQQGDADEQIK
jgi:hypothetical protein